MTYTISNPAGGNCARAGTRSIVDLVLSFELPMNVECKYLQLSHYSSATGELIPRNPAPDLPRFSASCSDPFCSEAGLGLALPRLEGSQYIAQLWRLLYSEEGILMSVCSRGGSWLGMIACDCIPRPHDARMLHNWPDRLGVAVGELKPGPGPSNFYSWSGIYLSLCQAR